MFATLIIVIGLMMTVTPTLAAVESPYASLYDNATPADADWKIKAEYETTLATDASANFTIDVCPLNSSAASKYINVTYYIYDEILNYSKTVSITSNNTTLVTGYVNFTAEQMAFFDATSNGTLYITVEANDTTHDTFQTTISLIASSTSAMLIALIPTIVGLMVIVMVLKVTKKI